MCFPSGQIVSKTEICAVCYFNLTIVGSFYKNFMFHVMPLLFCDAIIEKKLLLKHKSITFELQCKLVVLIIMSVANVFYSQLFGDNRTMRRKLIGIKEVHI